MKLNSDLRRYEKEEFKDDDETRTVYTDYTSQASDDHLPMPRMTWDGVPSSANWVAPPVRIEVPPRYFGKKKGLSKRHLSMSPKGGH